MLIQSIDWDLDGISDFFEYKSYDENNNLLSLTRDDNADGNIDYKKSHSYDVMGNMLTEYRDFEADGTVDYSYTFTYDENGNKLTRRWVTTVANYEEVSYYSYECFN
jgi:hypothetical protein